MPILTGKYLHMKLRELRWLEMGSRIDPGKAHLPPHRALASPISFSFITVDKRFRLVLSKGRGQLYRYHVSGALIRVVQAQTWSLTPLGVCPIVDEKSDGVLEGDDWLGWHQKRSHPTP